MMLKPARTETIGRAADYLIAWRLIAAVFFAVSRTTLAALALLILFGFVISPPLLTRLVLFFALLPGLAAVFIRWAFAVDIEALEGKLVLRRRGLYPQRRRRVVIDCAGIGRIVPWSVPLPGPGLTIRMARNQRRYALQMNNPASLIGWISGQSIAVPTVPSVAYAQARVTSGIGRWYWLVGKYGLFSLLPAFIFFRLHQYINYGGLFGQYYLNGLQSYLSTFAYHWIMAIIYLMLYASIWRGFAEGVSLIAAYVAPAHAVMVRRWAERTVMVLYYGGVPALIALRFLV